MEPATRRRIPPSPPLPDAAGFSLIEILMVLFVVVLLTSLVSLNLDTGGRERELRQSLDRLLAIGGGSQSPYWVELLATVLDLPIDLLARGELGAALGAARLARCAASGADPNDVMTKPPIARTVMPRRELTEAYEAAWLAWRRNYPKLKELI